MIDEKLGKNYKELLGKSKELIILQSTASIVQWDMETKMPPRALDLRSQQLAQLELIGHKMLVDPSNDRLLNDIKNHNNFDSLN